MMIHNMYIYTIYIIFYELNVNRYYTAVKTRLSGRSVRNERIIKMGCVGSLWWKGMAVNLQRSCRSFIYNI